MKIDLVFIVAILGHILGDFYLQTNQMARARKEKYAAVVKHGVVYALTMAVVFVLCMPLNGESVCLCAAASVLHFIIDTMKYVIVKKWRSVPAYIGKNLFLADQIVHFFTLALCWWAWGQNIEVYWFISQKFIHLPHLPIMILLGMLCVTRPVGIWIAESDLRHYGPARPENEIGVGTVKNAGRTIGYLERLIVMFFLMYQQFGAIAFVLTAKSVARFKEIEQDQSLAEYYLIGTLMSVGSAMVITVLLGLCSAGA